MICMKCREGSHLRCVDSEHRDHLRERRIPGVETGGNWCDCQHTVVKTETQGDPNDC